MSELPFEKQVLNMLFAKINHNFEDISKYESYIQQLSFDELRAFSSSLYSNLNLDLMFVGNLLPRTALSLSQQIVNTLQISSTQPKIQSIQKVVNLQRQSYVL